MIIQEMEKRKEFDTTGIKINTLFYADDSLQFSHSIDEARDNIKTLLKVSRECPLEINKEKSTILIHNL